MNNRWKSRTGLIFYVSVIFMFVSLSGCGTIERKNDTDAPAVRDKVNETLNNTVGLLERKGNGTDRMTGYAAPGMPMRLPAKVIRIYIAPMKSPMGRLIGEHYVWAVVKGESWWTPRETGLDTIVPSDNYKKNTAGERED